MHIFIYRICGRYWKKIRLDTQLKRVKFAFSRSKMLTLGTQRICLSLYTNKRIENLQFFFLSILLWTLYIKITLRFYRTMRSLKINGISMWNELKRKKSKTLIWFSVVSDFNNSGEFRNANRVSACDLIIQFSIPNCYVYSIYICEYIIHMTSRNITINIKSYYIYTNV